MRIHTKSNLSRIVWNITNKCNFNCSFCYTNSNPSKQYGLSTETLLQIAKNINQTDVKVLSLIGGEPLLRKDIGKIIDTLNDNIHLKLDTNGSLLFRNWNKSLERINSFSIGIEGEKSVNEIERKSTINVIKSIYFLINKDKTVNVPILVNKNNYKNIKDSLVFIFGLGVKRVQVNKFIPVVGLNNEHLSLSKQEEDFVILSIIELLEERPELKNKLSFSGWKSVLYFTNLKNKDKNLPNCRCGELSAAISFDGDFVPCTVLSTELTVPKLKQKYYVPNLNIDDILDSYHNSPLFKQFRNYTSFLSNQCINCKFNYSCNHGCRAYALISTNDIFSHDPTCNLSS